MSYNQPVLQFSLGPMSHYIYIPWFIHSFIQAYVLNISYVLGSGGIKENKIDKLPASWNLAVWC